MTLRTSKQFFEGSTGKTLISFQFYYIFWLLTKGRSTWKTRLTSVFWEKLPNLYILTYSCYLVSGRCLIKVKNLGPTIPRMSRWSWGSMLLTPMRSPIFKWIISPSDPMTIDPITIPGRPTHPTLSLAISRRWVWRSCANKNRIFSAAHKVQGEKGAHPTISHTKGWFTLYLVVSNPSEKYAPVKIGSFPQFLGWKFQKCLKNHHPVFYGYTPEFTNKTLENHHLYIGLVHPITLGTDMCS